MTRRLRVAMVSRWYPRPGDPFSGSFVRDTVRAVEPVCDVSVVVPRSARLREVEAFVRSPPAGDPSGVPMPAWPLGLPARALVLDRAIGRVKPDVVHLHLLLPDGVPALVAARRRGVPLVVTEHVDYLPGLTAGARGRLSVVQTLRRADAVLVGSETLAAELRSYEPRTRVHVVGNPVDTSIFAPDAAGHRDIALSACLRLGEAKGTDVLLEAWSRASAEASLPRLVLVGAGPELDRFRALARRLGIDGVEFAGLLQREQLAALMRRASFFVSASRSERFALVVAEAIASGTPVVSTRAGGPEEYVTGDVGMLVAPGDVDGLAAALVRMSAEAGQYDAEQLHRHVHERYGFERVRDRLVGLYRSLVP